MVANGWQKYPIRQNTAKIQAFVQGCKNYENSAISRRLDRVENKQVKAKALLKRLRGLLQRAMPAVSRGSAIKNVGVAESGLALGWALGKAECAVL